MRIISAAEVDAALDYKHLIERLRQAFRSGAEVPVRHHHEIPTLGDKPGNLLIMPAWQQGRHLGIKLVTVFPDNQAQSLPAVIGSYMLLDAKTGKPKALIDGSVLTVRRTACASALASSYLSRSDAQRLLMVGTGALAPHLILAHAAVRPIRDVLIWGRDQAKAEKLAKNLARFTNRRLTINATVELEAAVQGADIISCATMATDPLVFGEWLEPGTHLDLVGAFRPDMREADEATFKRGLVFVDTRDGALAEAGDVIQAIERGAMTAQDIVGDLFGLTRGESSARWRYNDITVFKSVGTALEDLAAAELAFERA
ncbi:MAG: ornithine cyclodeaminase family protein [Pseudomonadota bacterium]